LTLAAAIALAGSDDDSKLDRIGALGELDAVRIPLGLPGRFGVCRAQDTFLTPF